MGFGVGDLVQFDGQPDTYLVEMVTDRSWAVSAAVGYPERLMVQRTKANGVVERISTESRLFRLVRAAAECEQKEESDDDATCATGS